MRRYGIAFLLVCLLMPGCSDNPPKDPNERSQTDLYLLKGVQYLESGRLDVARQDLEHAVELDVNNAEAHNALGVVYERLNWPEQAEEHYKKALAADENHFAAANNYGRLLCMQGHYDQAMKFLQTVTNSKLYQTPWLALTNAGVCAKSSGRVAESEAYLRKALETNPNFALALVEMAKLSLEKKNYLSARAFLQRFGSLTDPTPESLFIGVQTEQGLGNAKDADTYLRKLQQQFPDSKEALRSRKSHAAQ